MEIERKDLVTGDGWDAGSPGSRIVQSCLTLDPERSVRIRLAGDQAIQLPIQLPRQKVKIGMVVVAGEDEQQTLFGTMEGFGGETGDYHCISRVVDRRFVFGDEERDKFHVFTRMQEKKNRGQSSTDANRNLPKGILTK